jgi:dienelactone hydrolase
MFKYLLLSLALLSGTAMAKIVTKKVEYKSGDKSFEGFLAYDDAKKGSRPGVMIVHNWMGVTSETEAKAIETAKLGYVAFAGDIYGKGVRPADASEAGKFATSYKTNVPLLRERALLALEELKKQPNVDKKKLFVSGYCFGGTTALEVARSGADILGAISFHGGLATPNAADAKNIKGQLLVNHGAIDPFVSQAEVQGFLKEMNDAKVNFQFNEYSGAVHSFTDKGAGDDVSKGQAYNAQADKRSWEAYKDFLAELSK